jgi:hypothetical protein
LKREYRTSAIQWEAFTEVPCTEFTPTQNHRLHEGEDTGVLDRTRDASAAASSCASTPATMVHRAVNSFSSRASGPRGDDLNAVGAPLSPLLFATADVPVSCMRGRGC